jgi:hypothetical protein
MGEMGDAPAGGQSASPRRPPLRHREIPGRMAYRAGAIRQLLELGPPVSVNSEDPGMKRSLYAADLLLRVRETAWISPGQRAKSVKRLDRYARRGSDPAYNCGVFEEKEQ